MLIDNKGCWILGSLIAYFYIWIGTVLWLQSNSNIKVCNNNNNNNNNIVLLKIWRIIIGFLVYEKRIGML